MGNLTGTILLVNKNRRRAGPVDPQKRICSVELHEAGEPELVMAGKIHAIHGYIAAGKTRFARSLAQERDAVLMVLDEWLVPLVDVRPDPRFLSHCIGVLRPRLTDQALLLAERNTDVVLDFAYWSRRSRDELRERAAGAGVTVVLYWVRTPRALMRQRAITRRPGTGIFAIDAAAFDALEMRFEPLGHDEPHRIISTSAEGGGDCSGGAGALTSF